MYDHSTIFYPISKKFYNFSLRLNMAKPRHVFFSALGPETEELTCSFEKVIQTFAFRDREKFDTSFYFKILGII